MSEEVNKTKGFKYFFQELFGSKTDFSSREADSIIKKGQEDGLLSESEAEILKGVFYLETTRVDEIMVPRVDMVFLSALASVEEIVETYTANRYGKMPLYGDNVDDVVGILNVKDILPFWNILKNTDVSYRAIDFASLPHFIPESKTVMETIRDLQKRHISVAMVVDEYGGICGMVTIEDLVEEIVGEIQDSRDLEEEDYIVESPGVFVVNARMEIADFNELFNLDIQSEDYHTVGGYVLNHQEKIPKKGDQFIIDYLKFEVIDATRQRIVKLKIQSIAEDN
ncbi:MAG: hypothetical protein APR63_06385 [Desulfuromonas sp. SDB]|nr:MAG: hypothetical protein APR63_06385 [Desulfuromonas sp. SDB]